MSAVRKVAASRSRRAPRAAATAASQVTMGATHMIERRKSKIEGFGVFATARITKNTRIINYAGQKISNAESRTREHRYLKQGHIWCFELTSRSAIDANVGGNDARFINHACKPNCYSQIIDGVIWIKAARTILPGEELTYDYHTDGAAEIPCRCRPGCPSVL